MVRARGVEHELRVHAADHVRPTDQTLFVEGPRKRERTRLDQDRFVEIKERRGGRLLRHTATVSVEGEFPVDMTCPLPVAHG